ncbi:MAG TPA: amino acid racemase, partial [Pyrinomonadaceae bacterium]|nr:amino acid racemase [Pyrinomonadaceae bacterium]
MRTLGLIGGTGPESTVEYYRLLTAKYREQADGHSPPLIITSIDLKQMIEWMTAGNLAAVADGLVAEFERLYKAGADFAALTANTAHIVFDEVQQRSPLPLISMVEATCEEVQARGLKSAGLLGTRFTMQAPFYPAVFSRAGVKLVVPTEQEQDFIHGIYLGELLKDVFRPETRTRLLEIADEMKRRDNIDCLILGGTELPLLLRDENHNGMP